MRRCIYTHVYIWYIYVYIWYIYVYIWYILLRCVYIICMYIIFIFACACLSARLLVFTEEKNEFIN